MEIDLHRLDLLQTEQAEPHTLAVFDSGKSLQQKVVLGDRSGVLQCFGVRKTEVYNVFKSLPMQQMITSVTTGLGEGQGDKAFIASDQTIRGTNKKGKEFFRFNTNLTERIRKVVVSGQDMWLAGEYNFNQYLDCKDRHFYMSPDRINDMQVISGGMVALGCQDRTVRVISGNEVYYEAAVDGAVTALQAKDAPAVGQELGREELLYTTGNGQIGQILLDAESIQRGWTVGAERQAQGVAAMHCRTDVTGDGVPDIVVGRSNGDLEVWTMDEAREPQKVMSKALNEAVQALDTGFICTADSKDILLQTYSGRVVAFTNSPSVFSGAPLPAEGGKRGARAAGGAPVKLDDQLARLQADVAELSGALEEERSRSDSLQYNAPVTQGSVLDIRHSFVLDERSSCKYVLTVEAPVPVFGVAVQSDVPLALLEDEGTAIFSQSPPDLANGAMTLATYRCQEATNRVDIAMEVVEGAHGTVQAFVIPNNPPKTCNVVTARLRPLCLHCRVESPASAATPLNELKVLGDFEMSDIHSWIAYALPEVSGRQPIGEEAVIHFRSTLLGTYLTCTYRAGQACFLSDSISALAILREAISKEANSAKVRVAISYQLNQGSVGHMLGLLWPQLSAQRDLAKKVRVMEALQEIKMQDGDTAFLSDARKEDLENAEQLRRDHAAQPRRLQYLIGVVKDLFIDWNKFNGTAPSSNKKLPQLDELLQSPDTGKTEVVKFILGS
mmetsp:Transcript_1112/g.2602  ORF Transcript_1112/g.2602 Transcript_1112/m.2602 type:complete len:727 (+) Transcript_1112:53-2233(+)|eukprot:jgi/Tetstr1/439027/TSEL_027519.t1